jgi:hypothetical protein
VAHGHKFVPQPLGGASFTPLFFLLSTAPPGIRTHPHLQVTWVHMTISMIAHVCSRRRGRTLHCCNDTARSGCIVTAVTACPLASNQDDASIHYTSVTIQPGLAVSLQQQPLTRSRLIKMMQANFCCCNDTAPQALAVSLHSQQLHARPRLFKTTQANSTLL